MPITLDGTNGITLGGQILNSSSTPILQQTGSVLQVVTATTSTQVTTSNTTTYSDTGLSATITPTSANSKILIIANHAYGLSRSAGTAGGGTRLLRNSTVIFNSVANSASNATPYDHYISAGGATSISLYYRAILTHLDSPNTTSAVTYKTQGASYVGTNYYQVSDFTNGTSTIILMEIAG